MQIQGGGNEFILSSEGVKNTRVKQGLQKHLIEKKRKTFRIRRANSGQKWNVIRISEVRLITVESLKFDTENILYYRQQLKTMMTLPV